MNINIGYDMPKYLYCTNRVRLELRYSNPGNGTNWLFIPGGPGVDSSYLRGLADLSQLPGNVWLGDFPGNGTNHVHNVDYSTWLALLPEVVAVLSRVVLVGHSFGGSLALLHPELEEALAGLVLLNAAPRLWFEESIKYSQQFDLPDVTDSVVQFNQNPCDETLFKMLDSAAPYYFGPNHIEVGRQFLASQTFQIAAGGWWQQKAYEISYAAAWIPQQIPTLVVSGERDCIVPKSLFEEDQRFHRPNIKHHCFQNAGHFPWIEDPEGVRNLFQKFSTVCG